MEGSTQDNRQEKAKRVAVGATVAGVLLAVFLLVVLVILFVQMGVRNSELAKLNEGIAEYEDMIKDSEGTLEEYRNGEALYWRAVMQGWKKQ